MNYDAPDGLVFEVIAGVAYVRVQRPAAGNSLTRPMVAAARRLLHRRVGRPGGAGRCVRARGGQVLHRARSAAGPRPRRDPARSAPGARRAGPRDAPVLAAADHVDPRLREAGDRGAQRHRGRCRRADRAGLRSGDRRPERAADRDLRQARHRPRCGRGLPAHPPRRVAAGQADLLLRRARPGRRGAAAGAGHRGRARCRAGRSGPGTRRRARVRPDRRDRRGEAADQPRARYRS